MQFASMSLGIFDFLIDWLTKFMIWLIGWVFELINKLFAALFFKIGTSILTIADNIQVVFKRLCGMDVYWITEKGVTKEVVGMDPVMSMFTNSQVTQALIALTLVAVAMVIIATIVQIIRTEFSTEGSKNSKGGIIGQSLKAMLLFILVPLCCIGGVFICNRLLVAVDRATNVSDGNSTIGSSVFVAAASNANNVRNGDNLDADKLARVGISYTITENNRERAAATIDSAFRDGKLDYTWILGDDNVKAYYNILEINYITYIGGGLLATYTLLCVCFGLVMRIYKCVVLFIISPPVVGLMPIDNGSAFKDWRKSFLKEILSAYGTVVGLNLLFLILPILNNIKLFEPEFKGAGLNSFMQLIFTLTGLFMLKDISGMIAGIIGGGDAASAGAGMMNKVTSTATKIGAGAMGVGTQVFAKGRGAWLKHKAKSLAKDLENDPENEDARQKLIDTQAKIGKNKNLASFGRKFGTGALTGQLAGVAKKYSGGVVDFKTGNDRIKAREEKQKQLDEERKARKEAGRQTTDDIALEKALDDKSSRAYARKNRDGTYGIDKALSANEKTISDKRALEQEKTGLQTGYGKIKAKIDKESIDNIKLKLDGGDSMGASEQISEMLNALNSIADKTEDQKDLIQKLTNLQGQVTSASGNKKALAELASSNSIGVIGSKADKVNAEATAVMNVVNNTSNTLNSTVDIDSKLHSMAARIVAQLNPNTPLNKLENKIAEMERSLASTHKAELEALKEKKK